jgi:putative ABC transport system ATP-binding protein
MPGATIAIEGVGRLFHLGGEDVWALRDITMSVTSGELLAVIGRSGSGKTTLLNLIAGLDRPTRGTIRIDDDEVTALPEGRLTALRRNKIGFVFQSFGLLPLLSAYENVELAMRIGGAGRRDRARRTHEVLELMGLGRRANHRPYELSGGEQQRVAIARAIANRPSLILADEPTGELDSTTAATIFHLLREVTRTEGITIVVSTHDRIVMETATRVEELADGRLLREGQRALLQYVGSRGGAPFHPPSPATPEPQPAAPEPEPAPEPERASEPEPALDSLDQDLEPQPSDDVSRWARPGT